jgi:hypothetical protein
MVFGDFAAYSRLIGVISSLHRKKRSSESIKPQYYGMSVVLRKLDKARGVELSERFAEKSKNMELIVSLGSTAAADLARKLQNFLKWPEADFYEHIHFGDPLRSGKSVVLSFRYPLKKWDESKLGAWSDVALKKRPEFLPEGRGYRRK